MSKTIRSNVELLKGIIPEDAPEGMLPRAVYEGMLDSRELRSNYVDRLNEFGGLLMRGDVSEVERQAFIQIRSALHTNDSHEVHSAMQATLRIYDDIEGLSKEDRIAYIKELADTLDHPDAEKVHHPDKRLLNRKLALGSEKDLGYTAAAGLAICFAGFSAFTGFLPAAFNLLLASLGGMSRSGDAWTKWRKRPEIISQYPDLFNLAILETYAEGRLSRAFEPLQSYMDHQIEDESERYKVASKHAKTSISPEMVSVEMATSMLIDLIHKAPSRAVRLLRSEEGAIGHHQYDRRDPRHIFEPLSSEKEAQKDKLSLERVFRQRFAFDVASESAIDHVRSSYSHKGVDIDDAIGDLHSSAKAEDRFEKVSPQLQTAARKYADRFARANIDRDMPMMRKIFDVDDSVSKEEAAEQISLKVQGVLERLAVAINYERRDFYEERASEKGQSAAPGI